MPAILPKEHLDSAAAAVEFAQSVRRIHRRKSAKGNQQREVDIQTALDRLKTAMAPLRKAAGSFPYGPQTDIAEENRQIIRDASISIQKERRRLWKMKQRSAESEGTDAIDL